MRHGRRIGNLRKFLETDWKWPEEAIYQILSGSICPDEKSGQDCPINNQKIPVATFDLSPNYVIPHIRSLLADYYFRLSMDIFGGLNEMNESTAWLLMTRAESGADGNHTEPVDLSCKPIKVRAKINIHRAEVLEALMKSTVAS
jgi:hypothetical protein